MIITQRQAVLGMLGLQIVGALVLAIISLASGSPMNQTVTIGVALLLYAGLLAAYIKGWEPARYINAVVMALSVGSSIVEPFISQQFAIQLIVVPIIILIMTDWIWSLGSIVLMLGIALFKAGWSGIYTDPQTMLLYAVTIAAVALLWKISQSNELRARLNAQRAEEARGKAERDQQLAEDRSAELAQINKDQESLLDLVSQLEIPAIQVAEGVLITPLIGNIDTRRAQIITQRLLSIAYERRVHLVILDVTGVSMLDTTVAQRLIKTAQSLQLLGCQVTISGVTAQIALSLTQMGVALNDMVQTTRTPQDALDQFYKQQRVHAN